MDKNKEEELKATQEMAGSGSGSFYIVGIAFSAVLLGALSLYPGVTWAAAGQGALILTAGFVASAAF